MGCTHIGKFLVQWAELGDAACSRLLGGGNFGSDFEHLSVGECLMVAKTATGFLMDTFGVGLGERIKAEFDEVLALQANGKVHHFTQEELDNLLRRQRESIFRQVIRDIEAIPVKNDPEAEEVAVLEEKTA